MENAEDSTVVHGDRDNRRASEVDGEVAETSLGDGSEGTRIGILTDQGSSEEGIVHFDHERPCGGGDGAVEGRCDSPRRGVAENRRSLEGDRVEDRTGGIVDQKRITTGECERACTQGACDTRRRDCVASAGAHA